jgi:hypothetical protein
MHVCVCIYLLVCEVVEGILLPASRAGELNLVRVHAEVIGRGNYVNYTYTHQYKPYARYLP